MMRLGLALMVVPAIAFAEPDAKLLEQGRALEAKGKHAEAIAAYEAYLKAAPDDVIANAELGFAALQAKDLVVAEAATRKAIDKAPKSTITRDPTAKPRGAALYNLGLILEAEGKPKDAATAYKDSLAERPSKIVREKLYKLDPALAATVDPLAPQKLAGPFADLKAMCVAWLKDNHQAADLTWGENGSCSAPDMLKVKTGKLAKPFLEIQALQWIARENLEVAIKLADGWYRFEYTGGPDRGQAHCGGTIFTLEQLPLAATAPQLTLEYTSTGTCFHTRRSWDWAESGTIAIGIGPSGKPSAPVVLVTSLNDTQEYEGSPKRTTKTRLSYAWGKSGSLDVTGNLKGTDTVGDSLGLGSEELLGHHVVQFP